MGSFKIRRKQSKYKQILNSELNIECSDDPSKNLMIGNAGLVTGLQYEQLAKLFAQYGQVESIVMLPKKSYCFVVFSTIEDAVKAYNAVNAQTKLHNMDGPMYLLYTKSVPKNYDSTNENQLPQGLTVLKNFVSVEEEEVLHNCIEWDTSIHETDKTLKHRRVKHYGYEFCYDINNVDKTSPLNNPIPKECDFIVDRLKEFGHPLPWVPNQLTVNQYKKGQGIPSHIDTHSAFETPLLSLSLGSDVVMEFKREESHVPILLPRRSLLIMDGEARYTWSHGITPRTMDVVKVDGGLTVQERDCRTSFTFRRVRESECDCQYPAYCDSQKTPSVIQNHQANQLETRYVHEVYNNIASHFSDTRTKIWPNVLEFVKSFPLGSILLDAGCGNGKNFGLNPNIFQVGFDRCPSLTEVTHNRGHEVIVCDCLSVLLRDESCDGLISVAVLHHLSTRERRLQALREMARVLAPGGRALVTVWAKDQTKQDKTAYLKQDRKNRKKDVSVKIKSETKTVFKCFLSDDISAEVGHPNENDNMKSGANVSNLECSKLALPVHTARTEFEQQDVFVPWKVKTKPSDNSEQQVFYRYYHVFEENELCKLCSEISNINILQTYYTEGNWCIVFQKHFSSF